MSETLESHITLAEPLSDGNRTGLIYAWFGFVMFMRGRGAESYQYLRKSLALGEENGDGRAVGLACGWLTFACYESTLLDEGIAYGKRARDIGRNLPSDQYIFYKSLNGISYNYWVQGNRRRCFDVGQTLLKYGEKYSNVRSSVVGFVALILSHHIDGNQPFSRSN